MDDVDYLKEIINQLKQELQKKTLNDSLRGPSLLIFFIFFSFILGGIAKEISIRTKVYYTLFIIF
jgi:hypothetical protein